MRPGRLVSAVAIGAAVVLAPLTVWVWLRWAPLLRIDQKINIQSHEYGVGRPDWLLALAVVWPIYALMVRPPGAGRQA